MSRCHIDGLLEDNQGRRGEANMREGDDRVKSNSSSLSPICFNSALNCAFRITICTCIGILPARFCVSST